ncbi:hypothetical protein CK485_24110 [Streptomyces sp. ICBB 8177]|nr:hypothetical protein CK485_24110 [Streptomyces sp. ICBB 8177]
MEGLVARADAGVGLGAAGLDSQAVDEARAGGRRDDAGQDPAQRRAGVGAGRKPKSLTVKTAMTGSAAHARPGGARSPREDRPSGG